MTNSSVLPTQLSQLENILSLVNTITIFTKDQHSGPNLFTNQNCSSARIYTADVLHIGRCIKRFLFITMYILTDLANTV